MEFQALRALLAPLPRALPPPPRAITPVVLPEADGRAPAVPRFPSGPARQAAVLLLLHPGPAGDTRIVLTERAAGDHRHAGQVSLPGGAVEDGETIVEAALREAAEEVGLDAVRAGLEVVGTIAPVDVRVSGFLAHPVVALAPRPPILVADGREVAAIIDAPLAAFLPDAPIEMVTEDRDGFRLRYGAYRVGPYLVWGATARILGGLGAHIGGRAAA